MKSSKKMYLQSVMALVLCISMLIGTTFAWFSDSVTSRNNVITSGNLDLEMYWTDDLDSGEWYNVEDEEHNTIFNYDNWEPGYTDVKYIKLVNAGSLALNYQLSIDSQSGIGKLAEVINVYYINDGVNIEKRSDLDQLNAIGLLSNVMDGGATANGTLLAANQQSPLHNSGEVIITIAMSMITTADNEYQDETIGDGFTVTALATQAPYEEDSFGSDYDVNAEYPEVLKASSATAEVTPIDGKVPVGGVTLSGSGVSAFVTEGTVLEDGVNKLTLTVTPLENTTSDITVVNNEILIPVDVHIEGVAEDNTVPIIIDLGAVLPKYLNMGNYHLFHVEDGVNEVMTLVDSKDELVAHNQFTYDSDTGAVSVAMASFSEVAVVADTENSWKGEYDYSFNGEGTEENPYIISKADELAGFGRIVGGMDGQAQNSYEGKFFKLISDINLGDGEEYYNDTNKIFHPIGYYYTDDKNGDGTTGDYYSTVSSFEGNFDGNGHTISNFYQNTWEIKGDYEGNYYSDAMGLFGYVVDGTIKNLTVDYFTSDGEFTPTGVIAAYAVNSSFENIAITNCNPRVYNTGNGGIVGVGGLTSDTNEKGFSFTNITIDNSNKITALWGSWDVACGGIMGMFRGHSTVHFDNCHVAAQIDVYNDVCGNYQYYWYRYSGMMIGTNYNMTTDEDGYTIPDMTGITAEDCTVHFGDWNDYYYCELVANSLASYTHDHQFSRLTQVDSVDADSMTYTINGTSVNIPTTGRYNYVVVDGNANTENATCYHFVNGQQWNHEDAGYEDVDTDGDGVTEHVLKEDRQHYFLPFNQLFTGYGWGVKHIPVGEFPGITILKRDEADSVTKFKTSDTIKSEYPTGYTATIGELFSATGSEVEIKDAKVKVFVSPVDENSTASGTYVANTSDWTKGKLTFSGSGAAKITITDYYFCKTTTAVVTITEGDLIDKFEIVLPNHADYLYRVGNQNTVALGSLFEKIDGVTVGTVSAQVTSLDDCSVSGTYSENASDWTKGTIKFSGTGPVVVTISDDNQANPVSLCLEVVDAVNATTTTSATSNDVVLLNNTTGGFTVSNGHAFYGNGFKVTCSGNGSYGSKALSYGFITVSEGGILDNVQVICDIFPESYLYTSEMTAGSDGRYPYAYSAIAITGNSTISNCYVYGARNNIFVGSGNVIIENTVTECGSLSNIQIKSSDAYTVTLDDVTTIQYETTSNYDTSKTVLGFGVVVGDNESASNPTIKLTGDLKQYNWVTSDNTDVSNSYAKQAISAALEVTAYQHTINGTTAVNMGIAYLNAQTANYIDERENKSTIPYALNSITMAGKTGQVFSIAGSSISATSRYNAETDGVIPYTPVTNRAIMPTIGFAETQSDALTFETVYDSTDGRWVSKLIVDLDNIDGGTYTFAFSSLKVQKYSNNLNFVIQDSDGNTVDKSTSIELSQLLTAEYTLVITDNLIYGANGVVTSDTETHYHPLVVNATKTSIDPPVFTNDGTATAIRLVESKGGDWRPAYEVLTGVTVTYWSASEKTVKTVDLSTLYNSGSISSNVWTYTCDDYTLTITGGQVHSDGSVITPVVANNTLYFASTNKAFTTGTTTRNIVLTYVFADKNASTTLNRTETVTYSDLDEYDYDSFKNNGTLTEASSSSTSCVTPDTLITLSDGSQVHVDSLTGAEELLVWNMETGKLDSAPIMFVDSDPETEYEIIHLYFSDGTDVKVISEHGFWDYDLNKYVYLDKDAAEYIGHKFAKQDGDILIKVTLTDVVLETEMTTAWSPVTAGHLCYFVNGMLSMPGGVGGLFNIFDVDAETMTYDYEAMARDIEKYGLFTYEELSEYVDLPREMFDAAGGQYLKVSIGKGNMTMDELIAMIIRYNKFFE